MPRVYCATCGDGLGTTTDPRGDVWTCDRHATETMDERWEPTGGRMTDFTIVLYVWPNGAYVSGLDADFDRHLSRLLADFGPRFRVQPAAWQGVS